MRICISLKSSKHISRKNDQFDEPLLEISVCFVPRMYMFFYCSKILIVLIELTPYERSFVVHGFLVSNESVVLSRWESENDKNSVSFIKRVDKG